VALCAFAFLKGIHTTADLQWPYDLDQYRDLGMAQAILDGRYGTDHLYLGESIWYNPLVSIIVAALSRATAVAPFLIIASGGVYINLLAPLAFYFLIAYLFDRWIALAASAAFLFAPIGDAPSWAAASYSPWLFTQNFVQALFYVTLAAYFKALESKRWSWDVAVGVLLGITFLGHTAPAIILGLIMLIASLKTWIQQSEHNALSFGRTRELIGLALILCIAFVVSLPFTVSILGRYHLAIVNHATNNWKYPSLVISNLPTSIRNNLSWFNAFALLGLFALATDQRGRRRKILLLSWVIICCAAIGLNFLDQLMPHGLQLAVVPAHHFLFYLSAVEDVLFGIGLVFTCRILATKVVPRLFGISKAEIESGRYRQGVEKALIALATMVFVILAVPAYLARFDFTNARSQAVGFQQRKAYLNAYHWILSNTRPEDVFLSLAGDLDLSIVGPADRKVVVTCQPEFSNPYVDWKSRADTASKIVEKLAQAAPDALSTLAENHVDYIITSPIERFGHEPFSFLSREFAEDDVVIYKVRTN
jgi:hypothetical protein